MSKKHKNKICPYCKKEAEWVSNEAIYGKKYGKSHMIWLCKDCDAYVGCHNNSKKALGTLANKETRNARKITKDLFINKYLLGNWNCNSVLKNNAYEKLSQLTGIKKEKCHFGMFSIDDCKKAYLAIKKS